MVKTLRLPRLTLSTFTRCYLAAQTALYLLTAALIIAAQAR